MALGRGRVTTDQLRDLQRLSAALGEAVSLDDVARATLASCLRLDGVVRAALAVTEGNGRQLQFVSTDEGALTHAALRWCLIDVYDKLPLTDALRSRTAVVLPSLDALTEHYPDLTERQRSLGTGSMVALPLLREDDAHGGLLLSFRTERSFDDAERAFLSAFAAQVTAAVRRGQAYQIQHNTSEQLQRSLLPLTLPALDGLALGSYYQPGGLNVDVGGDWYDVLPLPDGSAVISLGDVMGKGLPAAIVMSEVRAATRAYALLDPSPSLVMERLDRLVSAMGGTEQIVTMLYGLISPARDAMRLVMAGHPAPLLVRPASVVEVSGTIGPALGLGAAAGVVGAEDGSGSGWPENQVALGPDSTVLFFSDGLVESRSVDLARGVSMLRQQVSALGDRAKYPRDLCARLGQMVAREEADDDVTVLAAAVTTARAGHSESRTLPADPSAAGLGRRFVTDRLTAWGVEEDLVGIAELCVSELVTNAVIHSGTAPQVTVRADSRNVMVLVQDSGNRGAVQAAGDLDPLEISGRGLSLVEALVSSWNAEHNADGTTVWFELERAGAEEHHAAGVSRSFV